MSPPTRSSAPLPFDSPARHGFLRAAVCIPSLRVADPAFNAERTIELAGRAARAGAVVSVFPELGLSAYSIQDLFHQEALLGGVLAGLEKVVDASTDLAGLFVVGAPLRFRGRLYNCAVVIHDGAVAGVVPKSYLPNYREFYEKRHFAPAGVARRLGMGTVQLLGREIPFGNDLVFAVLNVPELAIGVEICEDLWAPVPPSTAQALAGAAVLCNLSASNVTIAKADYRRLLCASQSGRTVSAYLYAAAGSGESTTDLAWDGHGMIHENAELLAESTRFADGEQLVVADLDLERLTQERMRWTPFSDAPLEMGDASAVRRVELALRLPQLGASDPLRRRVSRFPYVPADPARRDERCREVYEIQVQGLAQRLRATGIEKLVVGVSGGLDSTQALLVAAQTMDRLKLPRTGVLAYTMPGFATSERTHGNAWRLMRALGVSADEIDIRPSARQMLVDLDHPASRGEPVHDVTYENVQAGARTSHLFRLANRHGGLVVGTGDLSELALGWSTYGVGDQMSHYGVNASVPKTLIRHLIRWRAEQAEAEANSDANGEAEIGTGGHELAAVLRSILDTAVSPELVPGTPTADGEEGEPAQRSEEIIGPYDLQDFHLYWLSRYGFRPSKVAYLALQAWGDPARGGWPEGIPADERHGYDLPTIRRWLRLFLHRFFQTSQFKRSALPDGPKVGSGGSLSPRGDWRAPSDASADAWLRELDENVP